MNLSAAHAQYYPTILPNTKACVQGSPAQSGSYCVDATPCKVISGITVCLQGTPLTTVTTPATLSNVSCPAGKTLSGGSCLTTATVGATPAYSCQAGYTLSGSSCSLTTSANASPNYSCPAGAVLSGSTCTTTTGVTSAASISSYSCPVGTSLSGSSCLKTTTQTATTSSYSCPAGQTVSGSSCVAASASTSNASVNYYCPIVGNVLSGTSCIGSTTTPAGTVYSCPTGQTLSGTTCTGTSTAPAGVTYTCPNYLYAYYYGAYNGYPHTCLGPVGIDYTWQSALSGWTLVYLLPNAYWVNARAVYSCPAGQTVSGSNCIAATTSTATVSGYSCPSGQTVVGSNCQSTTTSTSSVSYSCPSGQILSGSNCTTTTTTTSAATPNYSCPSGFSLSGTSCSQTTSTSATANYSCPAGSVLSGTSCNSTTTNTSSAAIASYSCPAGAALSGSSCLTTTTQAAAIASYSCPGGGNLSGASCITTTSASGVPVYTCPAGATLSGTNCVVQGLPNNALMATFSCWSTAKDYSCSQAVSECSLYTANPACKEVGTATCTIGPTGLPMVSTNPKLGACVSYQRDFKCLATGTATTSSTTTCDSTNMLNGLDWSTSSPSASKDFVQAATSQEFARQIAAYGYDNSGMLSNIFHGKSMDCKDGYIGLKNCCATSGGAPMTNANAASAMGNVTMSAISWGVSSGAGYAMKFGAPYVYDLMLSGVAPEFMQSGLSSMAGSMANNTLGAGFGFYGIGTTASAAGGAFFGASSSMAIGQTGLYFNPYALAAAVAIQVIMQAISCSDEEKELANMRSQNLCHPVGSFCSNEIKFLGIVMGCLETTQRFCCFNGLLAKGIMEGAHSQMGISWGSAQAPNCAGLSVAQIQTIDFADPIYASVMAPFTAQIMSNYNSVADKNISSGAFLGNVQGTSTQNVHALCLQKQLLDPTVVCP